MKIPVATTLVLCVHLLSPPATAFLGGNSMSPSFLQRDTSSRQKEKLRSRLHYIRDSTYFENPLNYQEDIQTRIDVSRPYYALQNERVLKDEKGNEVQGFACDVIPEMPHGREGGTLTVAEAGRHMAIAGSIASAMVQPKDGKFYYLALDAKMSRRPFTGVATKGYKKYSPSVARNASIFAKCVDMGESRARYCSSEIILEITPDEDAWFLQVTYCMIPERLFRKMYGEADIDTTSRMQGAESPYINFSGLPNSVRPVAGTRTNTSISCHTTLPPPRPEDCLGHFDKNPALPIAYTFSFFSDLIAQTISELCGVPTAFRHRGEEEVDSDGNVAFIVCQESHVKAEELVFANSYGQRVECDVELIHPNERGQPSSDIHATHYFGATFRVRIRAFKEDGSSKVIFTSYSLWQLLSK